MFIKNETNQVVYYTSTLIPAPHGFSTRLGGKSTLPSTQSMNFGSSVDDRMVDKNIELFTKSVGLCPKTVRVKQIHSTIIHSLTMPSHLDNIDDSGFFKSEGDGFITNMKAPCLIVRTADCLPILMSSRDGKTVAALHAGWRGSVDGIAKEAVRKFRIMGIEPHNIFAALGPCISACCFRVGEDFIRNFEASPAATFKNDVISMGNDGFYCDLKKLNLLMLTSSGVPKENIDISPLCTMHHPQQFFSHRRTGFSRGTMGSAICTK